MVSIIMPVYNSEKYLPKAIESVLNQTYKDFELLLVNDGSKDNSLSMCQAFADRDNRIRIINKENGGLCSARNAGLDNATGEYIAFIDNDDEFDERYMEIAIKNLKEFDCDIFRCNRLRVQIYDNGNTKQDIGGVPNNITEPYVIDAEGLFADYYNIKKSGAMYGIWNGVYRAELFANIRFNTDIRFGGEDWLINLQLYEQAKRVVFVNDALYIYYRRLGHSTSTKFDFNRIDAILWVAEYERKLLTDKLQANAEEIIRPCNAFYLAQIIKVLENTNCPFNTKQKLDYLRKIRKDLCFFKTYLFKKPYKENICMWLYSHHMVRLMYFITKNILKKRGSI